MLCLSGAAVAPVVVGNALVLVLLLGGLFVDLVYLLPGFPEPGIALSGAERRELAADGVASIRPVGPGVEILREATLPSGDPAFNQREIDHMEDVRQVVTGFVLAWIAGLCVLAAAWLGRDWLGRGCLRRALRRGALATAGLIAAIGLALLVAFDPIFEGFHSIFFSGDSWRFAADDTLLQLYPEMFWVAAGVVLAILVFDQCLLVARRLRS